MKKKLKLDPNVVAAMKRNLFEKQLELRRLLHKACEIADNGESLLAMDPSPMTKAQWKQLKSIVDKVGLDSWDAISEAN